MKPSDRRIYRLSLQEDNHSFIIH